jgi:hypothetical protein
MPSDKAPSQSRCRQVVGVAEPDSSSFSISHALTKHSKSALASNIRRPVATQRHDNGSGKTACIPRAQGRDQENDFRRGIE